MRFLVLLLAPLLVGCASISPQKMVPEKTSYGSQHPYSVAVTAGGGSEGVQWFSETVKPGDFEEALRKSIEKSTLFRSIMDSATAEYLLSVNLNYVGSHPGFNMTAWVNTAWAMIERATGLSIWVKEVKSEGKATVGEEFGGQKRQILALERAVKANIESALTQIGALQLKAP